MIGLDTNIVVRYLTHDDAHQTAAAIKVMDSFSADSPGFVSLIVILGVACGPSRTPGKRSPRTES